jgi:CheY-like chemotaxis protein
MIKQPYVLLADDDEDDRHLFREVILKINDLICFECVEDGSQLLEKLSHFLLLPDYIFLDLNMPCKTGHECLLDIRGQHDLKNIPVIIYSTSSRPEDINSTYSNGANLYIKKPNGLQRMEELLRKVFTLDWKNYFPKPPKNLFFLE